MDIIAMDLVFSSLVWEYSRRFFEKLAFGGIFDPACGAQGVVEPWISQFRFLLSQRCHFFKGRIQYMMVQTQSRETVILKCAHDHQNKNKKKKTSHTLPALSPLPISPSPAKANGQTKSQNLISSGNVKARLHRHQNCQIPQVKSYKGKCINLRSKLRFEAEYWLKVKI